MATDTLYQHYTTQFSTNWIHLLGQMKSRLDQWIEFDDFTGERKRYDRIGKVTAQVITDRKGATRIQDIDMDLRWAIRQAVDVANTYAEDDALNLGSLVLPTSPTLMEHTRAYNRDMDSVAIQGALGNVITGQLGTTPTALPGTQTIVHGGTGLTLAKLIQAREILDEADVDDNPGDRVLCVTPKQISTLLNTTEVKSADYNTIRALAKGEVDSFCGFKFVTFGSGTNSLVPKASTTRSCVGWIKGSVKVMRGAKKVHMDLLPSKQHTLQLRSVWHRGTTRLHDEGIVVIECTES